MAVKQGTTHTNAPEPRKPAEKPHTCPACATKTTTVQHCPNCGLMHPAEPVEPSPKRP